MLQYTLGGFMNEVTKFLLNLNINDTEPLIVGVSYGPDSMALLNIVKEKYPKNKIICAHVHHNHRKESDEEQEQLKKFCVKNNIMFEFMKITEYKNNKFTEEEARIKRYKFFEFLVKKYNSKYLFTAHHGDDLIETILMRITRGSTLRGYAGISLISNRDNYNIIRPLLFVTKEDILKYCNNKKINYAEDKSNFDDNYTRNRYRKYILPYLKKEDPKVHKKFLKFSLLHSKYDDYFTNLVNRLYDDVVNNNVLNLSELLKNDEVVIRRIVMRYLHNNYGNEIIRITDDNTNAILSLISSNKSSGSVCLPNKKMLIKSYNKLYFDNDFKYNDYCLMLNEYVELPNGFVVRQINKLENKSNYVTAVSYDDVRFPLYIRNVTKGDRINVLGLNGSKKVQDIFINEKVPKNIRGSYPVVVDSEDKIIWIPGLKKSKYDKSKAGKYDIILKYYKEEKNDNTR